VVTKLQRSARTLISGRARSSSGAVGSRGARLHFALFLAIVVLAPNGSGISSREAVLPLLYRVEEDGLQRPHEHALANKGADKIRTLAKPPPFGVDTTMGGGAEEDLGEA